MTHTDITTNGENTQPPVNSNTLSEPTDYMNIAPVKWIAIMLTLHFDATSVQC